MTAQTLPQTRFPRMAVWKTLLIWLPAALLVLMLIPMRFLQMSQAVELKGEGQLIIAGLVTWALLTTLFFMILRTGRTHRYRSALFILLALLLPFYFIPNMIEQYGTVMLSDEMTYNGQAAFCPLTMPMVILPAILKGVVIFPGQIANGAGWFLLWLGASLAVGRGWCSWLCIYGGWDEFFSRLPRRARVKQVDRKWRLLPWGVLLAIVLLSAMTFHPIYCEWLCPFKVVSEFEAPDSLMGIAALVIFIALFIGLVIVLPLLTRKRVQCALFCPFGALQSFFNKISIFEVRVDPARCDQCKRCLRECPTLSLDEGSLKTGKALMSCSKCGQCVDACPKGAMSYHIKGTPLGIRPGTARMLSLYPAYILLAVLGGGIITTALWRVLRLVTTGSII
jgi:ferredoxin-type protein NapH